MTYKQHILMSTITVHSTELDVRNFHRKSFNVGTCKASRFDSNWTIPIRFESDGLSATPAIVPQTTLTVQQKKLQTLRRGN